MKKIISLLSLVTVLCGIGSVSVVNASTVDEANIPAQTVDTPATDETDSTFVLEAYVHVADLSGVARFGHIPYTKARLTLVGTRQDKNNTYYLYEDGNHIPYDGQAYVED
ncbi:hypothetical protein ACFQ3L_07050 [Lacticaseibacillus jixianensis]|uniref:Uncharacterized protein n=1 Tax=Lacticaseibacillus jixianensis TaxID=2486012 RepID=A0ABW4BAH2_9LACO|nr:hypothetical protein [Lacticaseibacillus jixianensis]